MVTTPDDALGESGTLGESVAAADRAALALFTLWVRAHHEPDVPVPATQLRALFVLQRGPLNMGGLAAELGALMSSASRLCDRLEAAGLLERDLGRDRREVTVRLSSAGQALLDRLGERRQRQLAEIFGEMSPQAVDALVWGLSQFQQAAAKAGPGGGSGSPFSVPA